MQVLRFLPDYPEGVSIDVPALDNVFMVLKHDLNKGPEIGTQDRCVEVHFLAGWIVWHASDAENTSDLKVVGNLKRGVGRNK